MRKPSLALNLLTLVLTLATGACGPAGSSSRTDVDGNTSEARAPQKVLQVINRGEPPSLAARALASGAGAISAPRTFFNAMFELTDVRETTHPNLAEALPQLNTDTWRVNADGTMETRYRLKPNLTWHDRTPLHADDFVFAHRVYKTPELGTATSSPMGQMEAILAPDPRSVVIRWSQPFVGAGQLGSSFQGLPRHILEDDYRSMDASSFTSHPFWTHAYVGLGPYKLDRWEPGAFLAASAFDNYALGRPKIDQMRVNFITDSQTALANVLAGEAHFVLGLTFSVDQGQILEREFAKSNGGRVLYVPTQRRLGFFQMRPEYQSPRDLANVQVRYAVAHGLDHQSRVDVLDGGKGAAAHSLTHFGVPWYSEVDRVVLKHDFDPRAAEVLMAQNGWSKRSDGFFANAAGERFTLEVQSTAGGKNEQEASVYVDSLRRTGFDAVQKVTPVALVGDNEYLVTRPGLTVRGAGANLLQTYTTEQIPTAENRWRGNNRQGWSNSEFDRLFAQLERTFPMNERVALIAQLERLISIDRVLTMNTWESEVYAATSELLGVESPVSPDAGGPHSGVHQWQWRS